MPTYTYATSETTAASGADTTSSAEAATEAAAATEAEAAVTEELEVKNIWNDVDLIRNVNRGTEIIRPLKVEMKSYRRRKKVELTSNEESFLRNLISTSTDPLIKSLDITRMDPFGLWKTVYGYLGPAPTSTETSAEISSITSVSLSDQTSAGVLSYAIENDAAELFVFLNGMFMTKEQDYSYSSSAKTITFISEYSDIITDDSTLSILYHTN